MNEPLVQVVDKNDNLIKITTKHDAVTNNLIHRIARVIVEDGNGNILLQKRKNDKPIFPGRWDNSAAGWIDESETYLDAAIRELYEEIGLQDVELTEIDYFFQETFFNGLYLNNFTKVYKTKAPKEFNFILQPDEVESVKWFSILDAVELNKTDPDKLTDGLSHVIRRNYIENN